MKTITTNLYEFSELSDSAKTVARQWYIDGMGNDWQECVIEHCSDIASLLGFTDFKIYFSGFWSQGDGACFTGNYKYKKDSVKAIKSFAGVDTALHNIAKSFREMQRVEFYQMAVKISHSGRYYHENSMRYEFSRLDGKESVLESSECFKDFAKWIYKQLEKEYYYQISDAVIDENIACNEYYFTIDGKFAE